MKIAVLILAAVVALLSIGGSAQAARTVQPSPTYMAITWNTDAASEWQNPEAGGTYTFAVVLPSKRLRVYDCWLEAHSNHGQYIYIKGIIKRGGHTATFTFTSDGRLTDVKAFVRVYPYSVFQKVNRLPWLVLIRPFG